MSFFYFCWLFFTGCFPTWFSDTNCGLCRCRCCWCRRCCAIPHVVWCLFRMSCPQGDNPHSKRGTVSGWLCNLYAVPFAVQIFHEDPLAADCSGRCCSVPGFTGTQEALAYTPAGEGVSAANQKKICGAMPTAKICTRKDVAMFATTGERVEETMVLDVASCLCSGHLARASSQMDGPRCTLFRMLPSLAGCMLAFFDRMIHAAAS